MSIKKLLKRSSRTVKQQQQTKAAVATEENSENTTCSDESSKASVLENLGASKSWKEFLAHVNSSWYEDEPASTTPLHIALMYSAPLSILTELIGIQQEIVPEEALDGSGKTPLHVAASFGAPKEVIELLLNGSTSLMPVFIKDANDQYPLHAACNGYKKLMFGRIDPHDSWNKRNLISILLEIDDTAARMPDKFGKTPLDYAKQNKLSHTVIRDLDKACRAAKPVEQAQGCILPELTCGLTDDLSTIGFAEMTGDLEEEDYEPSIRASTRAVTPVTRPTRSSPPTRPPRVVHVDDDMSEGCC